ncbi:hypothetical protein Tco_0555651 [Tanacetum coccineum]
MLLLRCHILKQNGNSFKPKTLVSANTDGTSTLTISGPVTTEKKIQKRNDVKARSILLMALPNENQLTFNQHKDAKTLFEAIQSRFCGNDATKKTQKTSSSESLDSIFNRLQKIGLRILALYHLPGQVQNEYTAYVQVSTTSAASTNDTAASLSDATVYAFLTNQPNGSQLAHEDLEQIHDDDLEEIDLKWECRNPISQESRAKSYDQGNRSQDNSRRTVNVEDTSSKAMVAIDGAGFDWSYMAEEEVPTNMALMAFSDSEFNLATYKRGLASVEEQLVFYKKNEVMFTDQIAVLKRDASFNESKIITLKIQIEKLKKDEENNPIKIDNYENASKSLDKLIGSQKTDNNRKGVGYNVVPPLPIGLFAPPTIDLSNSGLEEFKQPEFEGYGPKANKSVSVDATKEIEKTFDALIIEDWISECDEDESEVKVLKTDNVQHKPEQANQPRNVSQNPRNFAPTAILTKSDIVPMSTARQRAASPVSAVRPINTAAPKSFVNVAKPRTKAFQKSHLPSRRPFYQQGINAVKPSACGFFGTKKEMSIDISPKARIFDSGCSRHMTGNKSYLTDYQDYDGGFVAFAGSSKGGFNFWLQALHCRTATVKTVNNGEQKIIAIVDGHKFSITEASVRRHLQLADVDGISSLPNTEVFEKLTLMGDPTKQGRMEEAENKGVEEEYPEVEYHFDQTLLQQEVTPLKAPPVEVQSTSSFEAKLSVLSAAKILAKAYNTDEEVAIKVQEEEQAKALEHQEQERANLEAAQELQRQPIFEKEYNKVQTLFKKDPEVGKIEKKRVAEETMLQENMLKAFDREDLDTLWSLVKEKFRSVEPTEDMERSLWVELKRLYEPDKEDTLWKLQRYMHDPLTWRLYGSCAVHHVFSTRGHCIYMLPEKDYPLTTAVMMLMLSRRLQVEEDSEMLRDLVKKIFIEANKPQS